MLLFLMCAKKIPFLTYSVVLTFGLLHSYITKQMRTSRLDELDDGSCCCIQCYYHDSPPPLILYVTLSFGPPTKIQIKTKPSLLPNGMRLGVVSVVRYMPLPLSACLTCCCSTYTALRCDTFFKKRPREKVKKQRYLLFNRGK